MPSQLCSSFLGSRPELSGSTARGSPGPELGFRDGDEQHPRDRGAPGAGSAPWPRLLSERQTRSPARISTGRTGSLRASDPSPAGSRGATSLARLPSAGSRALRTPPPAGGSSLIGERGGGGPALLACSRVFSEELSAWLEGGEGEAGWVQSRGWFSSGRGWCSAWELQSGRPDRSS